MRSGLSRIRISWTASILVAAVFLIVEAHPSPVEAAPKSARPPRLPDLTVTGLSSPASGLAPGSQVTVTVTVKNIGTAGSAATQLYLYVAATATPQTVLAPVSTLSIGQLGAGASATQTVATTVPTLSPGTYSLVAQADRANAITESNEANNLKTASITIVAPAAADIVVSALLVPSTLSSGSVVSAGVTVTNQGGSSAAAVAGSLRLATTPDGSGSPATLATLSFGSVAAGSSTVKTVSFTVPSVTSGTYYVIADAQVTQGTESNTTNNRRVATVQVNSAAPPGLSVAPGDDLAALVDASAEGTTFILEPGVHRGHMIWPKNGQSFVGENGAILNGAQILTTFTRSGSLWVATAPTQGGGAHGECQDGTAVCTYPEDLFFDNQRLQRVASVSQVRAGAWYYDYGTHRAYVADSPSGHVVEISTVGRAFWGTASNVTIRGLVIEKYANQAQAGAVHSGNWVDLGVDWLVEENEIRLNHGAGISTGHGMVIRNNYIHHNGQIGIAGVGDDMLVDSNEIAYNNTAGFSSGWEAGGSKFKQTHNLVARNNDVHDNLGPGLWTDIDNIDTLYEGNYVADNSDAGIFHEISYRAIIRNNTVTGNGFGFHVWVWGGGIQVAASADVEVYGNTVTGNANGITAIQQNRGSGAYGPWEIGNLYVHDNVVSQANGVAAGLAQDIGDNSYFTGRNNRFAGDTYHVTSVSYAWMNNWQTATQWQAYGMDVNGIWQ
jgi:parallel beta-helix repeat protein